MPRAIRRFLSSSNHDLAFWKCLSASDTRFPAAELPPLFERDDPDFEERLLLPSLMLLDFFTDFAIGLVRRFLSCNNQQFGFHPERLLLASLEVRMSLASLMLRNLSLVRQCCTISSKPAANFTFPRFEAINTPAWSALP